MFADYPKITPGRAYRAHENRRPGRGGHEEGVISSRKSRSSSCGDESWRCIILPFKHASQVSYNFIIMIQSCMIFQQPLIPLHHNIYIIAVNKVAFICSHGYMGSPPSAAW